MFYYDRSNLSESTDHAKSDDSKECTVYHCQGFNYRFNF